MPQPAAAERPKNRLLADGKHVVGTFILVSSLFLVAGLWDAVWSGDLHQKLELTLWQWAMVQAAQSLGVFLMLLPAAWLATKLGYKRGLLVGLLVAAVGGFLCVPATLLASFSALLPGVFAVAGGLTIAETIAQPYTTILGDPRFAAARLNLALSFFAVGAPLGPIALNVFSIKEDASATAGTLWVLFGGIGLVVLLLGWVFRFVSVPERITAERHQLDNSTNSFSRPLWKRPHFLLAVVAQFFCVGAQCNVGASFSHYFRLQPPAIPEAWTAAFMRGWLETGDSGTLALSDKGVAMLAGFWALLFLAGRLSGVLWLMNFAAHKVLAVYALINAVGCLLIFCSLGWLSVACMLLSSFFLSIMAPTTLALGIHGLGARRNTAAAIIIMAGTFGGVLLAYLRPFASVHGISRAFLIPLACFSIVAAYGFAWPRFSRNEPPQ